MKQSDISLLGNYILTMRSFDDRECPVSVLTPGVRLTIRKWVRANWLVWGGTYDTLSVTPLGRENIARVVASVRKPGRPRGSLSGERREQHALWITRPHWEALLAEARRRGVSPGHVVESWVQSHLSP